MSLRVLHEYVLTFLRIYKSEYIDFLYCWNSSLSPMGRCDMIRAENNQRAEAIFIYFFLWRWVLSFNVLFVTGKWSNYHGDTD